MEPKSKNYWLLLERVLTKLMFALVFIGIGFMLYRFAENKRRGRVQQYLPSAIKEYKLDISDREAYYKTMEILAKQGPQAALAYNDEVCKAGTTQWAMLAYSYIAFNKGELESFREINGFLLDHSKDPEILAKAHYFMAIAQMYLDKLDKASFHCGEAEKIFIEINSQKQRLRTVILMGDIYYRMNALDDLERCLQSAVLIKNKYNLSLSSTPNFGELSAWVCYNKGNILEAVKIQQEVVDNYNENSRVLAKVVGFTYLTFLQLEAGHTSNAKETFIQAVSYHSQCFGEINSDFSFLNVSIELEMLKEMTGSEIGIKQGFNINEKENKNDPLFLLIKKKYEEFLKTE